MDAFAGGLAVVAGRSTGIGKAAARRLAAGGALVVICGRRKAIKAVVARSTRRPISSRARVAKLIAFLAERKAGFVTGGA